MNKQKGIASIAIMVVMLVMAVALPVTTKLVQQTQENRSKAATGDLITPCTAGKRQCYNGSILMECDASGKFWEESVDCSTTNAKICSNGACVSNVSTAPLVGCPGECTDEQTCVTSGRVVIAGTCEYDTGTKVCCGSKNQLINGVCNNAVKNICAAGTLEDITDSATQWKWQCKGSNGGTTDSCALNISSTPINGVCNNAVKNSCASGKASNFTTTATQYKWYCVGSNGGTTDYNCAFNISSAPVTNPSSGSCTPRLCSDYGAYQSPPANNVCTAQNFDDGCGGYITCHNRCSVPCKETDGTWSYGVCDTDGKQSKTWTKNAGVSCSGTFTSPNVECECGTLKGQEKGWDIGEVGCYTSSRIECSSLSESGFIMKDADGRCYKGICCLKTAVVSEVKTVSVYTRTSQVCNAGAYNCTGPTNISVGSTKIGTHFTTPTACTTDSKCNKNCLSTCPKDTVHCLGEGVSCSNVNAGKNCSSLNCCSSCTLSEPTDGDWCDISTAYGCKSGLRAQNPVEEPTKFTWKCNTSSCTLTKCTPIGDKRCNGDYVQICRSSGLWENTVCVEGEKCKNGVCAGPCIVGNKRCSVSDDIGTLQILQTCTNANGTWTTDSPNCAPGQSCVLANDKKSGTCVNPCTVGAKQCSGNNLQVCRAGANGTTGWVVETNCGANSTCTSNGTNNASCVTNPLGCSPLGGLRCFNNVLQQCDVDGSWDKNIVDCSSSNRKCVVYNNGGSGSCEDVGISCIPGNKQCAVGNILQTCNSAGNAWIDTDCGINSTCTPKGTNSAICVADTNTNQVCIPGNKQCNWNPLKTLTVLQTCKTDGTGWTDSECGSGQSCSIDINNPKSGKCFTTCVQNSKRCYGNYSQTCTDGINGTWGNNVYCGSSGCNSINGTCNSAKPTTVPTVRPTTKPTTVPTAKPTTVPTVRPTTKPTTVPTVKPTTVPTVKPTATPIAVPTVKPTNVPPIEKPTNIPTVKPTNVPTTQPTGIPTPSCTSNGISLSPSTLTLKVGESSLVTATNDCPQTPSGTIWSSSDGSIATVDGNGLVKAIAVGSMTITATNSVGKKATASVIVVSSGNRTLNFKISFSGIKPSYVNTNGERYNCLASLGGLSLEIANVPTNKYETFSDIQFSVVGNEVDSLGNQVFQVSNLPIGSALDGVNNFNYVKVKGPFHLKRRMCLDNQTGKLTETTVCNIDLNKNDGYIYDFSEYNLLAGDVDLNGIVNGIDFVTVKNSVNAGAEPVCGITNDLNMDGVVNGLDLSLIRDISLAQVDDE